MHLPTVSTTECSQHSMVNISPGEIRCAPWKVSTTIDLLALCRMPQDFTVSAATDLTRLFSELQKGCGIYADPLRVMAFGCSRWKGTSGCYWWWLLVPQFKGRMQLASHMSWPVSKTVILKFTCKGPFKVNFTYTPSGLHLVKKDKCKWFLFLPLISPFCGIAQVVKYLVSKVSSFFVLVLALLWRVESKYRQP